MPRDYDDEPRSLRQRSERLERSWGDLMDRTRTAPDRIGQHIPTDPTQYTCPGCGGMGCSSCNNTGKTFENPRSEEI